MIKLQDFARECGVTDRMIQKHLKNHEKELSGHFERRGKNGTWLDEHAQSYIRGLMVQQPVVVGDVEQLRERERLKAENDELLRENKELWKQVAELAQWKADNAQAIAAAAQQQLMLEDKAKEIEILEGFIRDAKAEIEALNEEKRAEAAAAQQAREELDRIRSASFWQRLRGWK